MPYELEMTDIKYKNAPVSEVIFGVTFKDAILGNGNFHLKLISKLIDKYPVYNIQPPLVNEELKGYQNNLISNPFAAGPALYRLRSADNSWLIQIQLNKLYLNWIRDDQKDPGHYPGYTAISSEFNDLLKNVLAELRASESDILYYELTYHDRIKWIDYVTSIKDIDQIVNYKLPQLDLDSSSVEIVNFNKILNAKIEHLGGFMSLNFATATDVTGKQILRLELSIKGNLSNNSMNDWFEKAHITQVELFEKIMNHQILKLWQQ